MKSKVWLVGAGSMAVDYVKVLQQLNVNIQIIGRGLKSAKAFQNATGLKVISGGILNYLATNPPAATHAIVAVGVEKLHETTLNLLKYGIKNILLEKPAGINKQEIDDIFKEAKNKKAKVIIGYNRRCYASVIKAKEIIARDGGVTSFNFDFTEWAHIIEPLKLADGVKEKLFLNNSTHVVDLAFYLGGAPKEICTYTAGKLAWHPTGSIFSGAGISKSGALFSYQANWESAGRWSVEMLTKQHRLIFKPLEKLQIQKKGSLIIEYVECNYALDELYKPGLYIQTENFLNNTNNGLCMIEEHNSLIDIYNKIAAYN